MNKDRPSVHIMTRGRVFTQCIENQARTGTGQRWDGTILGRRAMDKKFEKRRKNYRRLRRPRFRTLCTAERVRSFVSFGVSGLRLRTCARRQRKPVGARGRGLKQDGLSGRRNTIPRSFKTERRLRGRKRGEKITELVSGRRGRVSYLCRCGFFSLFYYYFFFLRRRPCHPGDGLGIYQIHPAMPSPPLDDATTSVVNH